MCFYATKKSVASHCFDLRILTLRYTIIFQILVFPNLEHMQLRRRRVQLVTAFQWAWRQSLALSTIRVERDGWLAQGASCAPANPFLPRPIGA